MNLTVVPAAPQVGIVGDTIAIAAALGGEWEDVNGLEVRLCVGLSSCEQPAATAEPDVDGAVNLAWDTSGQTEGKHSLQLLALIPGSSDSDVPNVLDVTEHTITLAPADGAVFVLIGKSDPYNGKILGMVAQPEPVIDTRAIYPTLTPTPTPTPLPRIDAEIISIASHPATRAERGQWVEIFVEVRNNGDRRENIPVWLTFPSAGKDPETDTVAVGPHQTGIARFVWRTRDYDVGYHTLRADLLLDDNTTSGATSRAITMELAEPVMTALIESVEASSQSAVVGEPVTIAVAVRNTGILAANIPVTLHFPSKDKQPETRKPRAEPGATVVETFTWRTSRYEPGEHVFRVEAPGSEWTFTVALAAPMSDFNVVEAYAPDPDAPIVKGDWVEVSALVSNAGPQAGLAMVTLSDVVQGRVMYSENLALEAQESRTVSFTWKTLRYAPGTYNLQVAVQAANDTNRDNNVAELEPLTILDDGNIAVGYGRDRPELQLRQRLSEPVLPAKPNFSIGTISWEPEAPAVGDAVSITVEVRNDGSGPGSVPVTLHFPSHVKQPETRKPRARPGETGVATFTWRTSDYEPGDHVFRVEAPGAERRFTVALVAPTSLVDSEIVGISSDPAGVAMQGEQVEIAVAVSNNGSHAMHIPVWLTFPSANKQPERELPMVQPGQTDVATFLWKTRDYEPGDYTLTADLLADGNATSGDTSATIELRLTPAVITATIADIGVSPASAVVGERVTVAVSVRNDSPIPANIPVTLHFPSDEKGSETRKPRARPGETGVATFTWRTSDYEPGGHVFRVEVPGDERSFTVALVAPTPLVDAEIVGIASDPVGVAMQGEQVEIAVTVLNNGSRAMRIPVWLTFPSASKQPERESPMVQPGQTGVATFTWKTSNYEPGDYTLTADLLADGNVTSGDTSATIELRLTPAVITATIADIGVSPASAVVGERVTVAVAVSVRNDSPITANIPVTLHFPSDEKGSETRKPRAGPGETGVATFTWRTSDYEPGGHVFRVEVPGDERSFTVALVAPTPAAPVGGGAVGPAGAVPVAPASFSIVGVSWSPKAPVAGEPVSITVEISNEGTQAESAPVTLYFPSADKGPKTFKPRVAPGETVVRKFTWLTGRYAPGTHRFRVETSSDRKVFFVELLPPAVDFVVAEIYPPSPSHPIVKGDWAEVAAFVRNLGEYDGRATILLKDTKRQQVMYRQSVSLESGESREVVFTWKTLRYEPGEYQLQAWAEARYDMDFSNNYSSSSLVTVLPNRDVTIGFGDAYPGEQLRGQNAKPRIRTAGRYSDGVIVLDEHAKATVGLQLPAMGMRMGAQPLATQAASPFLCAQQLQLTGSLRLDAELCPGVWGLVR